MPNNLLDIDTHSSVIIMHHINEGGVSMQKLEILDKDIMSIAIQQEIRRSEESRYDHRLHGVLLACQGFSCCKVAELFGQDSRTVQRWVQRFNNRGFAGLNEEERTGRPKRLDQASWNQLQKELRMQPKEFGYSQNLWDGKMFSHHLSNEYGVQIGVRQCQRIFRQMGFRHRKPRPVIAKADPEDQKAYKKTLHPGKKRRS